MGGFGSGERWSKKAVVEGCYSIDTATLRRWKLLAPGATGGPGSFEWRRGDEEKPSASVGYLLTVDRRNAALRLLYSVKSPDESLNYSVQLVTTPCHLGGVRWWFVCPLAVNGKACGRRVRKLYLRGRYFGCRYCHRLTYRSCQESDKRVYAMLRGELGWASDPSRMSVPQLVLALKALDIEKKRLDRWLGRDSDRGRGNGGY